MMSSDRYRRHENRRVLWNIFLHCLSGPIRNSVAHNAIAFPTTYNAANVRIPSALPSISAIVPYRRIAQRGQRHPLVYNTHAIMHSR